MWAGDVAAATAAAVAVADGVLFNVLRTTLLLSVRKGCGCHIMGGVCSCCLPVTTRSGARFGNAGS
jgi:hypothetical protein